MIDCIIKITKKEEILQLDIQSHRNNKKIYEICEIRTIQLFAKTYLIYVYVSCVDVRFGCKTFECT